MRKRKRRDERGLLATDSLADLVATARRQFKTLNENQNVNPDCDTRPRSVEEPSIRGPGSSCSSRNSRIGRSRGLQAITITVKEEAVLGAPRSLITGAPANRPTPKLSSRTPTTTVKSTTRCLLIRVHLMLAVAVLAAAAASPWAATAVPAARAGLKLKPLHGARHPLLDNDRRAGEWIILHRKVRDTATGAAASTAAAAAAAAGATTPISQEPLVSATAETAVGAAEQQHTLEVRWILTAVYLIIFIIGVVGNLCNCLVIADSRNRYMKTATNYYLFSLSVSDLLLLIFGLPHDLVNLWHPSPYLFNEFVCISRGWISEASTYASVLVIVAFTVERYLAICHPLKAHTLSRLSRSIKMIIIIWLVASSCALVVVMQFGIQTTTISDNSNQGDLGDIGPADQAAAAAAAGVGASTTTGTSEVASETNGSQAASQQAADQQPQQMGKAIAQCTTVALNETIFELSFLIFFVIPMAVITILYVRLGCHLRQKTYVIKQSRLARKQNLMNSSDFTNSQQQVVSMGRSVGVGLGVGVGASGDINLAKTATLFSSGNYEQASSSLLTDTDNNSTNLHHHPQQNHHNNLDAGLSANSASRLTQQANLDDNRSQLSLTFNLTANPSGPPRQLDRASNCCPNGKHQHQHQTKRTVECPAASSATQLAQLAAHSGPKVSRYLILSANGSGSAKSAGCKQQQQAKTAAAAAAAVSCRLQSDCDRQPLAAPLPPMADTSGELVVCVGGGVDAASQVMEKQKQMDERMCSSGGRNNNNNNSFATNNLACCPNNKPVVSLSSTPTLSSSSSSSSMVLLLAGANENNNSNIDDADTNNDNGNLSDNKLSVCEHSNAQTNTNAPDNKTNTTILTPKSNSIPAKTQRQGCSAKEQHPDGTGRAAGSADPNTKLSHQQQQGRPSNCSNLTKSTLAWSLDQNDANADNNNNNDGSGNGQATAATGAGSLERRQRRGRPGQQRLQALRGRPISPLDAGAVALENANTTADGALPEATPTGPRGARQDGGQPAGALLANDDDDDDGDDNDDNDDHCDDSIGGEEDDDDDNVVVVEFDDCAEKKSLLLPPPPDSKGSESNLLLGPISNNNNNNPTSAKNAQTSTVTATTTTTLVATSTTTGLAANDLGPDNGRPAGAKPPAGAANRQDLARLSPSQAGSALLAAGASCQQITAACPPDLTTSATATTTTTTKQQQQPKRQQLAATNNNNNNSNIKRKAASVHKSPSYNLASSSSLQSQKQAANNNGANNGPAAPANRPTASSGGGGYSNAHHQSAAAANPANAHHHHHSNSSNNNNNHHHHHHHANANAANLRPTIALNSTVNTASMQSVIKMLVSVVVMFFICWAPFHAQRLMAIYVREPTSEQVFVFNLLNHISGISYYISAVVNPILYSLFSMRFRQAFKDTFGSLCLTWWSAASSAATTGPTSYQQQQQHQRLTLGPPTGSRA